LRWDPSGVERNRAEQTLLGPEHEQSLAAHPFADRARHRPEVVVAAHEAQPDRVPRDRDRERERRYAVGRAARARGGARDVDARYVRAQRVHSGLDARAVRVGAHGSRDPRADRDRERRIERKQVEPAFSARDRQQEHPDRKHPGEEAQRGHAPAGRCLPAPQPAHGCRHE
jgi:hypothetical protein